MEEIDNPFIFITSQKGKLVLLHDGYRYNHNVNNKSGTSLWRCAKRDECSVSVTLNANKTEIIRGGIGHSCKRNPDKNENDRIMDICKKEACEKFTPIPKILEKKFRDSNQSFIPSFESKKDTLYRTRRNFLKVQKTEFSCVNEVEIPVLLAKDFLVCVDGTENDKIFLFSTKLCQEFMKKLPDKAAFFFGDGTFKVPIPFSQLYSMHVDIESCSETTNVVPILYALLPDKKQSTYERLFALVKHHFGLDIKYFKCDYEAAQINAFRITFPEGTFSGCYYHFNNAVWRKSRKLKVSDFNSGRTITRMLANLPLLPAANISEVWSQIHDDAERMENDNVSQFINYFHKQWIKDMRPDDISCFGQRHRTNNALEGWNRRFNARVGRKRALPLFIHALRKEAKWQDLKIKRALFDGQRRKKNDIIFDKKYKRETDKLNNQEITSYVFLQRLSHIKLIIFGD